MNTNDNPHLGGTFEDWLKEEGLAEDVYSHAINRVLTMTDPVAAEKVFHRHMTPEQRTAAAARADELTAQYLASQTSRRADEE